MQNTITMTEKIRNQKELDYTLKKQVILSQYTKMGKEFTAMYPQTLHC